MADTTMKITKDTKERLNALDLSEKGKSYDALINELITYYKNSQEEWREQNEEWKQKNQEWYKDHQEWKKGFEEYKERQEEYERLLEWAKQQGFDG